MPELDEIFVRLQEATARSRKELFDVCNRLANDEVVTDGDLMDALFTLTGSVDVASPLLPILTETLERYMRKCEMDKTPNGVELTWFDEDREEFKTLAAMVQL